MEILKVSSSSSPNSVAGAIAAVLRENNCVEMQSIGADATNQAVKAIAIARGYLAPSNIEIFCVPSFFNIEVNGEQRTAIRIIVEKKSSQIAS